MADTIGFVNGRVKRTIASGSGYWHEYVTPADILNVIGTDAVYEAATANHIGGIRMSSESKKIESHAHMGSRTTSSGTEIYWDGASDPILEIFFTTNGSLTVGQTIIFTIVCKYQARDSAAQKTQTVTATYTAPGNVAQYTHLGVNGTINWDEASNVLTQGDTMAFTINPSAAGTVKDIWINYLEFKFKKENPGIDTK